jgi:hypothetical protein
MNKNIIAREIITLPQMMLINSNTLNLERHSLHLIILHQNHPQAISKPLSKIPSIKIKVKKSAISFFKKFLCIKI